MKKNNVEEPEILSTHVVPVGVSGVRFTDYAMKIFSDPGTRNGIKKAIKGGSLTIDGTAASTGTIIQAGMKIVLTQIESSAPTVTSIHAPVIYEDDHIAVINKPSGIRVNGSAYRTLENALPALLKPSTSSGRLTRPAPVHRLDSATSGLILAAKTRQALSNLSGQFENRAVKKRYRAVVSGRLTSPGAIDRPIDGRTALSEYVPVMESPSIINGFITLVDLFPVTGRTHQLRRHMADEGHPVMGDRLYGKSGHILKGRGLFLCAVEISFAHPATGEPLNFSIDEPVKFKRLMEREKDLWTRYRGME